MSIANKLLKLAAKAALDRVLGKERTDELSDLLEEWTRERDQAKALAQVREQAADTKAVSEAVNVAIAGAGQTVTDEVRNDLEVAVAAGISKLVDPPSEKWLQDTFLPGLSKAYVVFSDDHRLTGGQPGRFFHFNWDRDSYSPLSAHPARDISEFPSVPWSGSGVVGPLHLQQPEDPPLQPAQLRREHHRRTPAR